MITGSDQDRTAEVVKLINGRKFTHLGQVFEVNFQPCTLRFKLNVCFIWKSVGKSQKLGYPGLHLPLMAEVARCGFELKSSNTPQPNSVCLFYFQSK